MDVSWLRTGDIKGIPTYARCLQIPDYHVKYEKVLPDTLALVRPFWLSEEFNGPEDVVFAKTPDFLFYTHAFNTILVDRRGYRIYYRY